MFVTRGCLQRVDAGQHNRADPSGRSTGDGAGLFPGASSSWMFGSRGDGVLENMNPNEHVETQHFTSTSMLDSLQHSTMGAQTSLRSVYCNCSSRPTLSCALMFSFIVPDPCLCITSWRNHNGPAHQYLASVATAHPPRCGTGLDFGDCVASSVRRLRGGGAASHVCIAPRADGPQ